MANPPQNGPNPVTPDEHIRLSKSMQTNIPRLSAIKLTESNVKDELRKLNVAEEAIDSTADAIKSVAGIPNVIVESKEGKIVATTAGQEIFEMPVFHEENILSKGGNKWMTVGGVTEFNAMGDGTHQSFSAWFNRQIQNIAENTDTDIKTRRQNLQKQVQHVFGVYSSEGADGGRAMVEPLSSGGRWKSGQAVTKRYTHSLTFHPESELGQLHKAMTDASQQTAIATNNIGAGQSGGRVSAAIKKETAAREAFVTKLFQQAQRSVGGNLEYSDVIFSATKRGVVDPMEIKIGNAISLNVQLSTLQPRDIVLFSDDSTAAKGFSQLRHAKFSTHDELAFSKTQSAQSNVGQGIKADRVTPIVQTRERFEWDKTASRMRGKKGTFQPMGVVATFVDPAMNIAFMKDSGAIRSRDAWINDPRRSTMGRIYTKKMSIGSDDINMVIGMFDKNVQKTIKEELRKQGSRNARQTLEFGTYAGSEGLNIALSGDPENTTIGYSRTTTNVDGSLSPAEAASRRVSLRNQDDIIEGFKINPKSGTIEFAIRNSRHSGSLGTSLLVDDKRITAPRIMDIQMEGGGAFDLLADIEATEMDESGKFVTATGEKFRNKGGGVYRRQLQTMAMNVEKRFGERGLKAMARAFNLTFDDSHFGKAPSLIAEPSNDMDFFEGLRRFEKEIQKRGTNIVPRFQGELSLTDHWDAEKYAKKVTEELAQVRVTKLKDDSVEKLLMEKKIINKTGTKIRNVETGKWETYRLLDNSGGGDLSRGGQIFNAYKERMSIAVFDATIVERVDRVTNTGIKEGGKSAGQIRASRLGYIQESLWTRAINAQTSLRAKLLTDFDRVILGSTMVAESDLVFNELKRLAAPFRGGRGMGTLPSHSYLRPGGFVSRFGANMPNLEEHRLDDWKSPVPGHKLHGTPFYDTSISGLREEGIELLLDHEVEISAGRASGQPGELTPKAVKTNRLYIPSPAAVLNQDAAKSAFMPSGGTQGAYIDLIQAITEVGQLNGNQGPTREQSQNIAQLYNRFSIAFAEDALGKGKALSNAAINPTAARYGALGALPHLKGDEVGMTVSGLKEMLKRSKYDDDMQEEILERARQNNLKMSFLADPMGTREHYRAVHIKLLEESAVDEPFFAGKRLRGGPKPRSEDVIYLSDALLAIMDRDLDADQGTISLLSSTEHHIEEGAHARFIMEQEALEELHGQQKAGILAIEDAHRKRFEGSLRDALEKGTDIDVSMAGAGRIVGGVVSPEEAVRMTVESTSPAKLTPQPETGWHKVGGILNRASYHGAQAKVSTGAVAASVQSIVEEIMSRSQVNTGAVREQVTVMVETIMKQTAGGSSQYHNSIKYTMLQKIANQSNGKQAAALTFWDELEEATRIYSNKNRAGELASAELDNLTKSILDVMAGGEFDNSIDMAGVKHPTGVDPNLEIRQVARGVAKELVAAQVILRESRYLDPKDLVAKNSDTIVGRQTAAQALAGEAAPANPRANRGGGAVAAAGEYQEMMEGVPRAGNLADDMADNARFEAQEAARRAQTGIDPMAGPNVPPGSDPTPGGGTGAGDGTGPRGNMFENFDSDVAGRWFSDKMDAIKRKWSSSAGFRNTAMIVGGIAAFEMVRSTVSATVGAFSGPDISTPTAPMPQMPLLDQPMNPTFDNRYLPQQNRARVQRTSGMRQHATISANSDLPVDFSGMPAASIGNYSSQYNSGGMVRDGRNSQAMIDEQARRKLYAAY